MSSILYIVVTPEMEESSSILRTVPYHSAVPYIGDDYDTVYGQDDTNNYNVLAVYDGTVTAYGPDCVGCSGKLGCPPHQDVRNGNIYYEDKDYGKIRILASDPLIPCGSVIKVSNYYNQEFYGIVLDRGSAIKGLTMDLLYESEMTTKNIGRQYNITFEIERWGFN